MSNVTVRPTRGVRGIGLFSILAGIVLILAGGATWYVVHDQLAAENITVSDDADFLAGDEVDGPFSAYAQAQVIDKHALEMADGKTYAELDRDDPTRETVMDGSFLRASLFTSVVAFGVCALVIGLGLLFILFGIAFRRLGSGPEVSVSDAHTAEAPARTSASAVPAAAPVAASAAPVAAEPTAPAAPQHAAPAATTPTAPTEPPSPGNPPVVGERAPQHERPTSPGASASDVTPEPDAEDEGPAPTPRH